MFKPTIALCGPCARECDEMAKLDAEVPNEPTCANCGGYHAFHDCMHRGVLVVSGE